MKRRCSAAALFLAALHSSSRPSQAYRSGDTHDILIEGDHVQGLEAEHHFELVSHDLSNASGWKVTEVDKGILSTIIRTLNPSGADSKFEWTDEPAEWTFGLVKLTAQTPKGSLALHMLHRHGIAPLIASRAGNKFSRFMKNRSVRADMSKLEFLVQSEEEFDEVNEMRSLLESLTLSALRNLHSYDHQWSVKQWAGKVPGCSTSSGATCILQGGTSPLAFDFLSGHGFSTDVVASTKQRFQGILEKILSGESGLPRCAYGKYLSPLHTDTKNTVVEVVQWSGVFYLTGSIFWEGGGVTSDLNVSISEEQYNSMQSLSSRQAETYVESLLEGWMEAQTARHKTFMRNHSLLVWTNEEAEFWEMYPAFVKASRVEKSKDYL